MWARGTASTTSDRGERRAGQGAPFPLRGQAVPITTPTAQVAG